MTETERIKETIRAKAHELGFDAVGFASADANTEDSRNLAAYLGDGRHGDMTWMAANADRRADPRTLWPEARTVVAVGLNYGPAEDPMAPLSQPEQGVISVYAQGRDYHKVMKKRLKALGRWMTGTFACDAKVFVDTAPVMEKPIAMRAGLGWTGKHTNLVSRHFGSWLFLGEVFTTLDVPADAPETDHCGSCDRCLRACPTGALPEPYRIDPRRCISYLTIEHRGTIDEELRSAIGNRIYGCDDCLAVCPWNKYAQPTPHAELTARADFGGVPLERLASLDADDFGGLVAGTPIKRTGRDRFVRNVMIAVGNSLRAPLASLAHKNMTDHSPLVRDAAKWAVAHLGSRPSPQDPDKTR